MINQIATTLENAVFRSFLSKQTERKHLGVALGAIMDLHLQAVQSQVLLIPQGFFFCCNSHHMFYINSHLPLDTAAQRRNAWRMRKNVKEEQPAIKWGLFCICQIKVYFRLLLGRTIPEGLYFMTCFLY